MEEHEKQEMQESLEAVNQLDEIAPEQEVVQPQPLSTSESNSYNIRRLREDKERLQREVDDLRRSMVSTQPQQEEDDLDLGADQFAEGKHLRKVRQENKQLRQEMSRLEGVVIETRLKTQFPDFNKVVNEDTIARLREEHPEIAATLATTTDKYSQAASAYKFIRSMGIYQETAFQPDKQRVQSNVNKPRPSNAAISQGNTPLAQANAFASNSMSHEEKLRLWQEMQQNIRGG